MKVREFVQQVTKTVTSPKFTSLLKMSIAAIALVKAIEEWQKSNAMS